MKTDARPPAVAGSFYQGGRRRLLADVEALLADASESSPALMSRMLIVPHAGHVYSGPVAASGYRLLAQEGVKRVGLIGPSHYVPFRGLAAPQHRRMETPLGTVDLDPVVDDLVHSGFAFRSEPAHAREHSLEVQLPFLQIVAPESTIAPLLTGDDDPDPARTALDAMLDAGLFVVVSSDLSHYHDHVTARSLDSETANTIVELREGGLGPASACGRTAVRGALRVAAERGWKCELLDLRTSGDTAGPRDRVVGYGCFVLGPAEARPSP
jgi:AmmeMemoRadiSam system protein B